MRSALEYLAAAGCVAFLASFVTGRVPGLTALGRLSMPVFVAHVPAMAAARIALQKFAGVTDLTLHLIVGVGAGIGVPLVLYKLASHFKVARLIGLGR